jgi:5-methylcytosine-specific restriction endonuclease McrA
MALLHKNILKYIIIKGNSMVRPYAKVLIVDPGGIPKSWVSYKEAILYVVKNSIAWIPQNAIKTTIYGGTCALTGLPSSVEIASILAIKGPMLAKLIGTSGHTPRVSNRGLFVRDHHRCAYCGKYFDGEDLTRDHIIPKRMKGKNTWQNLITSCKPCNGKKADRTPEKAGMKLKYQPYVPSRIEHLYFSNKKISDEQFNYIEGFVNKAKV